MANTKDVFAAPIEQTYTVQHAHTCVIVRYVSKHKSDTIRRFLPYLNIFAVASGANRAAMGGQDKLTDTISGFERKKNIVF